MAIDGYRYFYQPPACYCYGVCKQNNCVRHAISVVTALADKAVVTRCMRWGVDRCFQIVGQIIPKSIVVIPGTDGIQLLLFHDST